VLVLSLAGLATGLVWSQRPIEAPPAAPAPRERFLTVEETGKPPQKCRLLKYWRLNTGYKGYQAQVVETGEMLTILESGPPATAGTPDGGRFKAVATTIYHWGGPNPPAETPMPPHDAVVVGTPQAPTKPSTSSVPLRLQPVPNPATQSASGPQAVQVPPTLMLNHPGQNLAQGGPQITVTPAQALTPVPNRLVPTPAPTASRPAGPSSPYATTSGAPNPPPSAPQAPSGPSGKGPANGGPCSTCAQCSDAPVVLLQKPSGEPLFPRLSALLHRSSCTTCQEASKPETPPPPTLAQGPSAPAVVQGPGAPAVAQSPGAPNCPTCPSPVVKQPDRQPAPVLVVKQPDPKPLSAPVVKQPDSQPLSVPQPRVFLMDDQAGKVWGKPSSEPKKEPVKTASKEDPPPPKPAPVVSAPTSKPQPTDWRESWGKADMTSGVPQVYVPEKKTSADAARTAQPKPQPPTAVASADDPLRNPALYNKTVTPWKQASSPPTPAPLAVPPIPGGMKPGMGSVLASRSGELANGIGIDAREGNAFTEPAPKVDKPDPIAMNAFTVMQPDSGPTAPNGPTGRGQPGMAPGAPGMGGPAMPTMPTMPTMPAMARSLPADVGNPAGMKNAFTDGGNARPIPADFGPQQIPTNAFVDREAQLVPAMPEGLAPGMPPRMPMPMPPSVPRGAQALGTPQTGGALAMAMPASPFPPMMAQQPMMPQPAMMPVPMPQQAPPRPALSLPMGVGALDINEQADVPQLRTILKEALFPSHREWAADRLGHLDWRQHPEVVQSLMTTAKDDLAPMVRVSCVRSLARMKVNTVDVVGVLEQMEKDGDPRVRNEVQQCLAVVKPGYVAPRDPEVKPASGTGVPARLP
jgi:hypothetical protein